MFSQEFPLLGTEKTYNRLKLGLLPAFIERDLFSARAKDGSGILAILIAAAIGIGRYSEQLDPAPDQ